MARSEGECDERARDEEDQAPEVRRGEELSDPADHGFVPPRGVGVGECGDEKCLGEWLGKQALDAMLKRMMSPSSN